MTGPRWNQTTVSNHRSYKNAKAKMDKLNAEAPEGTFYELMPLNHRVTFRAISNPMKWRLIRKVYPQPAPAPATVETPSAEGDTSGYGQGFCRCGRVFMWGECAGGHKKKADLTPTSEDVAEMVTDPAAWFDKLNTALDNTDAKIADYAAGIAELAESNAKMGALLEQIEAGVTELETPEFIDPPRFPEGTPEYDAYAAELKTELAKWVGGEGEYAARYVLIAQSWRIGEVADLTKPWHILGMPAQWSGRPGMLGLCGTETPGDKRAAVVSINAGTGAKRVCGACLKVWQRDNDAAYEAQGRRPTV